MSDHSLSAAAMPHRVQHDAAPVTGQQPEWVIRGLFNAFLAVVAGIALTVVIWRAGYLASISSFAMAAGAVFMYSRAAGSAPRKGLVPLVLLIVAGLFVAFLAIVVSDLWELHSEMQGSMFVSRSQFIGDNLFRSDVLGAYGRDMAMFAVFGVLGAAGTMTRLLRRVP